MPALRQPAAMSVHARCIAIGVMMFLYWAAAFAAAVVGHWSGPASGAWWLPSWLTIPGHQVGRPLLNLLRSTVGHNHLYSPGTPLCWMLLLAAAAALGTGAWLLSALLATRRRQAAERTGTSSENRGNSSLRG
jgi:hypothetical protein